MRKNISLDLKVIEKAEEKAISLNVRRMVRKEGLTVIILSQIYDFSW